MENYLHPEAIKSCLDIEVTFGDDDNVPQVITDAINEIGNHTHYPIKNSKTKKLLNRDVVKYMNCDLIREIDPENDMKRWY